MKETAELISAIASLLWPVFAFTALFVFKKQIGDLVGRIKRGKLLGQEIELSESLNRLEESAVAVAKEVAALPAPPANLEAERESTGDDQIKVVLQEAARSPKAALILLASDIEKEARQLLASVGHLKGQRYVPLSQAIDVLSKQFGGLPGHIPTSLKFFWDARNRLVHGGEADSEEILRAIDSGVTILKALQAFPRETNIVHHPGVTVYRDSLCRNPWPDVRGVILETETPGGTNKFFRIFPTTRTHFQKGKRVAWEWSSEQSWGEAWYKEPDSGEIKPAWSSAMMHNPTLNRTCAKSRAGPVSYTLCPKNHTIGGSIVKHLNYNGFGNAQSSCEYGVGQIGGKTALVFYAPKAHGTSITNMIETLTTHVLSTELQDRDPREVRVFEHYDPSINPLVEWQEVSFKYIGKSNPKTSALLKLLALVVPSIKPPVWYADEPCWKPVSKTDIAVLSGIK